MSVQTNWFSNLILSAFAGLLVTSASIADEAAPNENESRFMTNVRQLTFDGLRSGEGYYNHDGSLLVFQSERESDNPFYQIYLQDLETGDITRVSPGYGKTTCAWVHPDNNRVMFSSTQFDPQAREKMKAELEFRASGQKRRYSWDYDPTYEVVVFDRSDKSYKRLTDVEGYDAEGCYSPDGESIVFASNRRAYSGELTAKEQELFKIDPASAMDIYIMDADGSNVRRLTEEVGYDGGPFFSPDGKRICWRRFNELGTIAEVYTMNLDGSDVKRLTNLGAMSWAPYFHPSGEYLIFTTNKHGFENFELYIVDTNGASEPVRITTTNGFDGLPVFTPDGKSLTWSSNRGGNDKTQLFTSAWSHEEARKALRLDTTNTIDPLQDDALKSAQTTAQSTSAAFRDVDIGRHIDYLCRPELGGRLTGTPGEVAASAYVAAYLEQLGCIGGFEFIDGKVSFFQEFPFTAGIRLGPKNELAWNGESYTVDQDWRPLALSSDKTLSARTVVFAGYGIVAPDGTAADPSKKDIAAEYDSYVHLDVKDKWVLVLRQMPMDITPERRSYLARFSSLRYKAMMARERGAAGLIVVSGPTSEARSQLVPLTTDGSLSGSQIAAISVTDALADAWFRSAGKNLENTQKRLDAGEPQMGFELEGIKIAAAVDVDPIEATGVNTAGLLKAADENAPTIIIGAHIDHLGSQAGTNSLARDDERDGIHRGADDNASGIAAMLEMAEYFSNEIKAGKLELKANILFAAWSGEELGLLGSAYFVENPPMYLIDEAALMAAHAGVAGFDTKPSEPAPAKEQSDAPEKADPDKLLKAAQIPPRKVSVCFNLDMVGRLRENLVLQGTGSSPVWRAEIEKRNAIVGLPLVLQDDSYLPTDASTFYLAGVPILSAFTGQHSEYHTPRDVPELINFEGAAKTAKLMGLIARSFASSGEIPAYTKQDRPDNQGTRAVMTAYLGSIPDYASGDIVGVKLAGVTAGAPVDKAGVKGGDIIVELAGRKIANIYDYTYAIEALKVGEKTTIVVKRGEQELKLDVTPSSRQ